MRVKKTVHFIKYNRFYYKRFIIIYNDVYKLNYSAFATVNHTFR